MKRIGFLGAYSIDNAGDQLLASGMKRKVGSRVVARIRTTFP